MKYTNRQIDNRIKKLIELENKKKELEKQIDEIKKDIQADLDTIEKFETENYIIRYTTVISSRLDNKTLKTELPEIYKKFSKETTSRRFTYKATA